MSRSLKPCGTPAAYRRHLRWGQEPCESCLEAEATRTRGGRPKPRLKPCGTRAAYTRHVKAGEVPCEACRIANNVESEAARLRRAERTDEIPHGVNGYDNWNCRCEVCSGAKSKANRKQRVQRLRRKATA